MRHARWRQARRWLGRLALALGAALLALAAWIYAEPFPQAALAPAPVTSTWVVDRHDRLLREQLNPQEGRGRWIARDELSPWLVQATIHAEDKRFYDHVGLDPIAVARSLWFNLRGGAWVTGASTLTQQTVKLTRPRRQRRALGPKLMEAAWALRLERALDKDQILTQYLNRAPYGNQLFGAEAAARAYFGKPASALSLGEAALLAALPQAPSAHNPRRHLDRALRRRALILDAMRDRGAITEPQRLRALEEPLRLRPLDAAPLAPHFTEYALREAAAHGEPLPDTLHTTLDLALQEKVEGLVRAHLGRFEDKDRLSQAAVVVLDNRRAEVLAWVGSRDYFDARHLGANDGVLARRQPGSTLKPFVYGAHLERGGTPADVLHDLPTHFSTSDGAYIPQNYDRGFAGPMSLREALGRSRNIPAVEVAARIGEGPLLERLRLAGFESLGEGAGHYGLALALGDGEVTLLELAGAYAALARLGRWAPTRALRGERDEAAERRIFSEEVSFQLLDILTDDQARAGSFGRHSALWLPFRVAAKTGTSAHYRDAWAVGATPDYTVAVWAGNFDGSETTDVSGARAAAPLMRQVFQALYPKAAAPADVAWPRAPRGLRRVQVCAHSGQPATDACPSSRAEWVRDDQHGAAAQEATGGDLAQGPLRCEVHVALLIDVRDGLLAGPGCDAAHTERRVFHRLPPRQREWGHQRGLQPPPEAESPRCPGGLAQRQGGAEAHHDGPRVLHPLAGDQLLLDPHGPPEARQITLRAQAPDGDLTWFIDGAPLARVPAPWTRRWSPSPGAHRVGVGRGDRPEHEVEVFVHTP